MLPNENKISLFGYRDHCVLQLKLDIPSQREVMNEKQGKRRDEYITWLGV